LFPPRIEGIRRPQAAAADTLRLCATERDAFLASMTISGKTYEQVGDCIGVSKQAVEKWKRGIPGGRVTAFCNATGTTLLRDFLDRERAYKAIQGRQREAERIAHIASYSIGAAA
jgi:DNA-binding CsgD family transcriptional regulator